MTMLQVWKRIARSWTKIAPGQYHGASATFEVVVVRKTMWCYEVRHKKNGKWGVVDCGVRPSLMGAQLMALEHVSLDYDELQPEDIRREIRQGRKGR